MKNSTKAALAATVTAGALVLTGCANDYNGVKGIVVEREHEVCGVELSMAPMAFDLQNTKGGASGSRGGSSKSSGSKPKSDSKPKTDMKKPEAPKPAPAPTANSAGGASGGAAGAAMVPLIVDKPTPAPTSTKKKSKSKGCKEKYEVEVRDKNGTEHEVKVSRDVWEKCTENKSFPKCAN